MIDKNYVEELKTLEDKKEAKAKLVQYGESFGLVLKKSKSFDNLVQDIEQGLIELANEPMPEKNEGLSISDLISADDDLEGKNDFIEGAEETNQEAKLLFDAPVKEEIVAIELASKLEAPIGTTIVVTNEGVQELPDSILFDQEKFEEAVSKIVESEKPVFELPKNFSPHLIPMGRAPGFVTLPWWIYEWIVATPNWKEDPKAFKHPSAHQTLFSLIYYIKRDGSIKIRETRNSTFVTLD